MSGLIQHYETLREDECILGLWRKSFLSDIGWFNTTDGPLVRIAELSEFPSWSWLSVDNPIK